MTEMYGGRWTKQFEELPTAAWIIALKKIENKDIQKGFNALKEIEQYGKWPPSAAEFYLICKPRIIKQIKKHEFKKYTRSAESTKLINELRVKL